MAMKYSVIIPAYNAEKTIERCLSSLCCQLREDIELLVINDGSSDRTHDICVKYAEQYPQIVYVQKENGGVSSARNMGLDQAEGDYILFLDSDDYVTENYFSMIDANMQPECELLIFGRAIKKEDSLTEIPGLSARAATPEETVALLSKALKNQLLNSPCNKVYCRNIIEQYALRFDCRLPIGEDKVFVVSYAVRVRNALCIPEAIYVVSLENKDSLSRKQRRNLCDNILLEHDLLFDVVEKAEYPKEYRKAVSYSFYRSAYTVISELYKFDLTKKELRQNIGEVCCRYAEKQVKDFGDLKHWLFSLPVRWKMTWAIDLLLKKKI